MSLPTQVYLPEAFIIFFLTLGPLKALGPFAQATRGADPVLLPHRGLAGHGHRHGHRYRSFAVQLSCFRTMARFHGRRGGSREYHPLLPVISNNLGAAGYSAAAPSASRG